MKEKEEDIALSDNFNLSEFTKSITAKMNDIDNTPSEEIILNLRRLVLNILQPLRSRIGLIINISSGYRCPALNNHKNVRGSKTSDHMQGKAADIKAGNGNNAVLFNYIKDHLDFDQLIWEHGSKMQPQWIHVSFRKVNRKQVKIATKVLVNGKYKTRYSLWK
jgi:hypothetical protein